MKLSDFDWFVPAMILLALLFAYMLVFDFGRHSVAHNCDDYGQAKIGDSMYSCAKESNHVTER